ncbi:hypothetical protein M513_00875 [Trichuris suis]|uniref:CCHC-type domain-containing protein n=1 Tax=Trichuris suis TaxID=68888 RepID=A0A085MLL6_9BILA|nr:hypothetical protein M513_00875 [Trichuris suis]
MLHGAPRLFDKKEPSETTRREQNEPFAGAVCDEKTLHCLLPIVPLVLVAPDGRCYRTRALLDSGSEVSMIHMDVASALGLKGARESCRFTTFHDQRRTLSVRRVSFRIKSTDGLYTEDIEDAYAVPKLQLPNQIKDEHSVLNSDADRLCILRELLAPQVRKAMAKYLYDPRQYTEALEVLQRRYGDPQRLVRACLKSVAALRPWHDFDYDGLRAFSDELQSIVSVLSLGGHEVEICSSTNVNTVVKKMPRQLRDEWGQFVTRSIRPRFPSLRDLSDWISERREAADMITDESDDPPCGVQRSLYDKKRRPRMVAAATLPDASALACPLCGGAHLLPSCPMFIRMRMERRAEVVRIKGCCYRCLQPGHTAKRCNSRSRCSETGCRAAHHPMLHGAPRLFHKEPSETTRREQNEPFTGAVCDEKTIHCLLPIVPLVLVAPDGRCYRTRALLDSGSEVSMIHMDVANALGLKGARESCRFTTFHNQQRTLSVRRVSFRIKSTDGLYTEDIEDAYAVPKLQLPNQIKSTGTAVQH